MVNTKGELRMLSIGTIVGNDPERALNVFPQFYIRGDEGQVFVRGTAEAKPFEIQERKDKDSARSRATGLPQICVN